MENNFIEYWEILESISNCSSFKEQADMFRYFAHVDALKKVDDLLERFLMDLPAKLEVNHSLTLEKYNIQCQSMVTGFLFQPPLFSSASSYEERKYCSDLFSNWKPNDYCMEFYKKLKTALNLTY